MTTKDLLLAHFQTPLIPLEKIVEPYFGHSLDYAIDLIAMGAFPITAINFDEDNWEAPWLILIDDLVDFIEIKRKNAQLKRLQIPTLH